MIEDKTKLLFDVAKYYTNKLTQHGATPQGVDWNGVESQMLRFEQISKIIDKSKNFSINDLGCGYGAFYDFLSSKYEDFSYLGIDISEDMVLAASQRHQNMPLANFMLGSKPDKLADYALASGIFNVRLQRSDEEWLEYIKATLDILDECSRIGFSFNCLTSYSDLEKMRDYLYYADPCFLFDLCKKRYSRNVSLHHDYELYEFTILVKK